MCNNWGMNCAKELTLLIPSDEFHYEIVQDSRVFCLLDHHEALCLRKISGEHPAEVDPR